MLGSITENWLSEPSIADNIVSRRHFPEKSGKMSAIPDHIHPSLIQALLESGIEGLYTHQFEAIQAICAGSHTLIVSGVASGKSLIYQIPILDRLLKFPDSNALLLFPTKALAHDQGKKMQCLISKCPGFSRHLSSLIGHFDGDTSPSQRSRILQNTQILFSNPDMLHHTLLPRHSRWVRFFSNLNYIVLDEIHVYRGVFGSHVANVLRRLKRIANYYGANPQFILTSGTISAPDEFASKLIEEPVTKIEYDTATSGEKHVWIYNPPLQNKELGTRRHPFEEAVPIVSESLMRGSHSIVFCHSRKAVELLLMRLREQLSSRILNIDKVIRSYRSGYLPSQRREIEGDLRSGETKCVIATNALELGIDIGALDITLIIGFPSSIASTWQQLGRSGRAKKPSLGILILSSDPLDQYLAHHPDYFWDSNPERVIIDPDNPLILMAHLRCGLYELPIAIQQPTFGKAPSELLVALLESLVEQGDAILGKKEIFYSGLNLPQSFSIRSISEQNVRLVVNKVPEIIPIGDVDSRSADWMVHPGAIYLHAGVAYQVDSLDLQRNIAILRECELDIITEPLMETQIVDLKMKKSQCLHSLTGDAYQIAHGIVSLTRQVVGYVVLDWTSRRVLERRTLSMPSRELTTMAFWLTLSDEFVDALRQKGIWNNDPNQYGPNWEQQKRLARQRDGYCCQLCGLPESGKVHHVHHKIPFRLFSSFQEANQLDNLITLCASCHQKVEQSVRVQSGMAALGYAMHHISPLFAMCDRQDLGVIVDPKFKWCDQLPTLLIHEQIQGGIGLTYRLYEIALELFSTIKHHIQSCPCQEGCPSCTGPISANGMSGKKEAIELLRRIV